MVAEGGEVLLPLGDREGLAAAVGADRADGEEELPGTDVEDAVAARVDQRQDGRGDRDADAAQPREVAPSAGARCAWPAPPARRRGCAPASSPPTDRARGLFQRHILENSPRVKAPRRARAGQLLANERGGGGRMLLPRQLREEDAGGQATGAAPALCRFSGHPADNRRARGRTRAGLQPRAAHAALVAQLLVEALETRLPRRARPQLRRWVERGSSRGRSVGAGRKGRGRVRGVRARPRNRRRTRWPARAWRGPAPYGCRVQYGARCYNHQSTGQERSGPTRRA